MESNQRDVLTNWLTRIQHELDKVTKFWMDNSHDLEHGGFFTCLTKDGSVYDDTKYVWLQARQVWMYARLYNEVTRYNQPHVLEAAMRGAEFLLKNCLIDRDGCQRCPFSTNRQGKPKKIQRSIFTECFFVMAMSEIWRATKEEKHKMSATSVMKQIEHWCMVDDSQLGIEKLSGNIPTSSLAVPMMALCLCQQMEDCNLHWSDVLKEWAIRNILLHVQRGGTKILENVSTSGEEIPGSSGRLQTPGHAIECGWFLLRHAMAIQNKSLAETAVECFINNPYRQGWDEQNGGLLYFIDADHLPPVQLEWNMKLWWPHNEAMVAFLIAFQHTQQSSCIEKFIEVSEYAFAKFSDPAQGEWFGYLNQKGEVSSTFKGGPWKGFFHVPRCLYLCEKLLTRILE